MMSMQEYPFADMHLVAMISAIVCEPGIKDGEGATQQQSTSQSTCARSDEATLQLIHTSVHAVMAAALRMCVCMSWTLGRSG